jgi:hypothetical protein
LGQRLTLEKTQAYDISKAKSEIKNSMQITVMVQAVEIKEINETQWEQFVSVRARNLQILE